MNMIDNLLRNALALRKYLRLAAFDTSTEQGRTDERYRLAFLSMFANVLSRSISMVVMVLSVRLTVPYLGVERFGVWMTIASFVGMLIFLDLGIGNALTNHVAKAAAKANRATLARTISGGLGLLFLLGILAGLLLSLLVFALPWANIIKVTNPAYQDEIRQALFLFSIFFGINLFSTGVQRVFAGLQRSFEAHAMTAIGSILSLMALWWAAKTEAGIPVLLLATLGCQSCSGFLLLLLLKKRGLFQMSGIASAISAEKKSLLKVGGLFFILQIGTMVGWGADSLIISSTLGAAQVAIYSVTQRLFQFVTQPLGMMNAPLWSAYADAHAHGDKAFIRQTLKKSMLLTAGITVVGGGLLFVLSQQLIEWWTKGAMTVPLAFVLMFFTWTLCETLGNSFAMMMNGCGVVREQVITVILLTTVALPAKLIFINYFGMIGMLASYTALYCAIVLFCYGFVYRNNLIKIIGPQ
jgi:O-antigen/teichoic acid export membrane protein